MRNIKKYIKGTYKHTPQEYILVAEEFYELHKQDQWTAIDNAWRMGFESAYRAAKRGRLDFQNLESKGEMNMRFSQMFLKMGYNTVVKVYKVVNRESDDLTGATVINTSYMGMFNRYDKVPKAIWSAHVYSICAEDKDVLVVTIEDKK